MYVDYDLMPIAMINQLIRGVSSSTRLLGRHLYTKPPLTALAITETHHVQPKLTTHNWRVPQWGQMADRMLTKNRQCVQPPKRQWSLVCIATYVVSSPLTSSTAWGLQLRLVPMSVTKLRTNWSQTTHHTRGLVKCESRLNSLARYIGLLAKPFNSCGAVFSSGEKYSCQSDWSFVASELCQLSR